MAQYQVTDGDNVRTDWRRMWESIHTVKPLTDEELQKGMKDEDKKNKK